VKKKIEAYSPVPDESLYTWLKDLIQNEIPDDRSRNDILELLGGIGAQDAEKSLPNLLRA